MLPTPEVLADWVGRLVRIPSVNPLQAGPKAGTPGEAALAAAAAGHLEDFGARCELVEVEPDRPNLYGLIPGRTERLVALDVHTDTVSVEHMTGDPFDGRVEDGRVWGRGAVDTKASLGVILALLEAWHREGLRPEPTLLVVGSISEEGGGLLGAVAFREWAEARGLEIDQLVVSEPTDCCPLFGHKGGVGFDVTVHGEAAHTGKPHLGRNAVVAAARAILALQEEHERLQLGEPPTEVGLGTLTTSMIAGGTGPNVVPDHCTFTFGRRIVPPEEPEEIAARLRAIVEAAIPPCTATFEQRSAGSAAFYQAPDTPFVQDVAAWAGTRPTTAPFGTNALKYQGFANQAVVFGPGSIEIAHKAEEWVPIDELVTTARVFTSWLNPA